MTPSEDEITTTITEIVSREIGIPVSALSPEGDLRSIEGADSVKVLVMISRIERTYDIEIEDEDVFTLSSVNDAVRIVRAALATAAA